jgi:hypothetical protein
MISREDEIQMDLQEREDILTRYPAYRNKSVEKLKESRRIEESIVRTLTDIIGQSARILGEEEEDQRSERKLTAFSAAILASPQLINSAKEMIITRPLQKGLLIEEHFSSMAIQFIVEKKECLVCQKKELLPSYVLTCAECTKKRVLVLRASEIESDEVTMKKEVLKTFEVNGEAFYSCACCELVPIAFLEESTRYVGVKYCICCLWIQDLVEMIALTKVRLHIGEGRKCKTLLASGVNATSYQRLSLVKRSKIMDGEDLYNYYKCQLNQYFPETMWGQMSKYQVVAATKGITQIESEAQNQDQLLKEKQELCLALGRLILLEEERLVQESRETSRKRIRLFGQPVYVDVLDLNKP